MSLLLLSLEAPPWPPWPDSNVAATTGRVSSAAAAVAVTATVRPDQAGPLPAAPETAEPSAAAPLPEAAERVEAAADELAAVAAAAAASPAEAAPAADDTGKPPGGEAMAEAAAAIKPEEVAAARETQAVAARVGTATRVAAAATFVGDQRSLPSMRVKVEAEGAGTTGESEAVGCRSGEPEVLAASLVAGPCCSAASRSRDGVEEGWRLWLSEARRRDDARLWLCRAGTLKAEKRKGRSSQKVATQGCGIESVRRCGTYKACISGILGRPKHVMRSSYGWRPRLKLQPLRVVHNE